jgi:cytochrome bd ubiquinol oxidase subunit I
MILLGISGLILWRKDRLEKSGKFLKFMLPAIAFPFLANTSGWMMTEVGRQPWSVFGVMSTTSAVSPNVSGGEILISFILYLLVFTILLGVMVYLIIREVKRGPEALQGVDAPPITDPFNKKVGA